MRIKFFPYKDSKHSTFTSDCNVDCIEVHLRHYIIGISFCTFKIWDTTWSFHRYPLDDDFNRAFEVETPTLGIMVLKQ